MKTIRFLFAAQLNHVCESAHFEAELDLLGHGRVVQGTLQLHGTVARSAGQVRGISAFSWPQYNQCITCKLDDITTVCGADLDHLLKKHVDQGHHRPESVASVASKVLI
eukprot:2328349-Pleurochrysis_carterae.AAC.3